jgi:HEAT repeat protein
MAFDAGELRSGDLGPALIECTKHGFAPLRREAASALGKIRFAPGADALRSLQADLDPLVREAAARALQNLVPR